VGQQSQATAFVLELDDGGGAADAERLVPLAFGHAAFQGKRDEPVSQTRQKQGRPRGMIPDLDRDYGAASKFAKQVPFEVARLLLHPGEGSQRPLPGYRRPRRALFPDELRPLWQGVDCPGRPDLFPRLKQADRHG
jgi:hypothetical protein